MGGLDTCCLVSAEQFSKLTTKSAIAQTHEAASNKLFMFAIRKPHWIRVVKRE